MAILGSNQYLHEVGDTGRHLLMPSLSRYDRFQYRGSEQDTTGHESRLDLARSWHDGGPPVATQRKRQFGNVRKLPSGRFQARYTEPDGHTYGPAARTARRSRSRHAGTPATGCRGGARRSCATSGSRRPRRKPLR